MVVGGLQNFATRLLLVSLNLGEQLSAHKSIAPINLILTICDKAIGEILAMCPLRFPLYNSLLIIIETSAR